MPPSVTLSRLLQVSTQVMPSLATHSRLLQVSTAQRPHLATRRTRSETTPSSAEILAPPDDCQNPPDYMGLDIRSDEFSAFSKTRASPSFPARQTSRTFWSATRNARTSSRNQSHRLSLSPSRKQSATWPPNPIYSNPSTERNLHASVAPSSLKKQAPNGNFVPSSTAAGPTANSI